MARKPNPKRLPIGEQIRLMRENRELSQRDLLDRCVDDSGEPALSKGGLSQVESGDRYPTLTTLTILSRALRCTFVVEPKATYIRELVA